MKFTKNTALFSWLLVLASPVYVNAMKLAESSGTGNPPPAYDVSCETPPAYDDYQHQALPLDRARLMSLFQHPLFNKLSQFGESAHIIVDSAYEGKTDAVTRVLETVDSSEYTALSLMAAARGGRTATYDTIYRDYAPGEIDTQILVTDVQENAPDNFVQHMCKKYGWSGKDFFCAAEKTLNRARMYMLIEKNLYEPDVRDVIRVIKETDEDTVSPYLCFLVEHGAAKRWTDFGEDARVPVPLLVAAWKCKSNVVRYLLDKGVSPQIGHWRRDRYSGEISLWPEETETSPRITRMLKQEAERVADEARREEIVRRAAERAKKCKCVVM